MQKLIPALLFAVMALVSCSKSDDDTAAKAATWVVAEYKTPGTNIAVMEDKTSTFAGYTFEFNDNNEWLIHAPNGATTTAQWGNDGAAVTLKMATPAAPADVLLGKWIISEQTDTALKLAGDSNSTAVDATKGTLNFQKQ